MWLTLPVCTLLEKAIYRKTTKSFSSYFIWVFTWLSHYRQVVVPWTTISECHFCMHFLYVCGTGNAPWLPSISWRSRTCSRSKIRNPGNVTCYLSKISECPVCMHSSLLRYRKCTLPEMHLTCISRIFAVPEMHFTCISHIFAVPEMPSSLPILWWRSRTCCSRCRSRSHCRRRHSWCPRRTGWGRLGRWRISRRNTRDWQTRTKKRTHLSRHSHLQEAVHMDLLKEDKLVLFIILLRA